MVSSVFVKKMTAASWHFRSVYEEDLVVLNDQ